MISIIDDDRSVREAVKSLIRSLGYEAVTFASAEEYLGADHAYDSECIITDVRMPGMTGIRALLAEYRVHRPSAPSRLTNGPPSSS